MRILAPSFLLFIFLHVGLGGCALTGVSTPETPREKYVAAEASYKTVVTTVGHLAEAGTIRKGSATAKNVATSLRTARMALNAWGVIPESPSRQQTALTALVAAQQILADLQGRAP